MGTHSSVLAWRVPGTGEPGGLPSMGSQSQTRLKRLSTEAFTQYAHFCPGAKAEVKLPAHPQRVCVLVGDTGLVLRAFNGFGDKRG